MHLTGTNRNFKRGNKITRVNKHGETERILLRRFYAEERCDCKPVGVLWYTFCSLQVWKRECVALRYIQQGVRPMVSHLRLLCLSLGILSTVMGCAATPPPMAPLRATLAPAAPAAIAPPVTSPPSEVPPAVVPVPYRHPPSATGTRESDTYQYSPYERKLDEEEHDYRQRHSAQEQAQEQRYQQWQQERKRERDPRYEWMR